jgi:hypothetical protein
MSRDEAQDPTKSSAVPEELPHLAAYIEQLGTPKSKAAAIRERDAWVETAAQFSRNEEYYRGLLDECAKHLGDAAFIADDNSRSDSPLRAKIPELVARLAPAPEKVGVREGWVLVPREPTPSMVNAGVLPLNRTYSVRNVYAAMVAEALAQPEAAPHA